MIITAAVFGFTVLFAKPLISQGTLSANPDDEVTAEILKRYPMPVWQRKATEPAVVLPSIVTPRSSKELYGMPNFMEGQFPKLATIKRFPRVHYAETPKSAGSGVR